MDYHQNARLTIHSREQLARLVLDQGLQFQTASLAQANFIFFIGKGFGSSPATLQRLAYRPRTQAQPSHH